MQVDQERPRLGYRPSARSRAQSLIVRALAVVGAGVMLVSAVAISIALFAIAISAVLAFGAYFWWKTRELRKQMRAQAHSRFDDGNVIDGVVIREVEGGRTERR